MNRLAELLEAHNAAHPHRAEWIPKHSVALYEIERALRVGLDARLFFLWRVPFTNIDTLEHLMFDTMGLSNRIRIGGDIDEPGVIYFSTTKWERSAGGFERAVPDRRLPFDVARMEPTSPLPYAQPNTLWVDEVADILVQLLEEKPKEFKIEKPVLWTCKALTRKPFGAYPTPCNWRNPDDRTDCGLCKAPRGHQNHMEKR